MAFIDDAKLLLGWTADAAAVAINQLLQGRNDIIDRGSAILRWCSGFTPPTDGPVVLARRYRLLAPPFPGRITTMGLRLGLLDRHGG